MTISIIGAGNMAHQLGLALYSNGHDIQEIYNRTYLKSLHLATSLEARAVEVIDGLDPNIDLLIISVSDDAIGHVVESLKAPKWKSVCIVHTSGSVTMQGMSSFEKYGVVYPFQSMTSGQELNFRIVPILVSSNNQAAQQLLIHLANSISGKVYEIEDAQRGALHIAGVFANNFSNHMFALAEKILEEEGLSFEIIKPLIENTMDKIKVMTPSESQTGPAVRGDQETLIKHLKWLDKQGDLKQIYSVLSESIIKLNESIEE